MENFTSVEFMTAEDKNKTFKDWQRFLKFLASGEYLKWNEEQNGSDYGMEAPKQLTKRLYNHLSLHCGFIAHYNIHGFYSEYFGGEISDLKRFFSHFEKTEWGGYNSQSCWGNFEDIGKAMADEFEAVKGKILIEAVKEMDNRWELIKECVKRADTDLEFRTKIIEKFL